MGLPRRPLLDLRADLGLGLDSKEDAKMRLLTDVIKALHRSGKKRAVDVRAVLGTGDEGGEREWVDGS